MKKISIQEFKNKTNQELIQELIKINNGYITSKLITELGIHRMYLSLMELKHLVKKVGKGVYATYNKKDLDEYYIFSLGNPKIIFSHLTALYLQGIYEEEPAIYEIAVPHKYHNKNNNKYNVYYLTNKYYTMGVTTVKTKRGLDVPVYDIHKSICEIIRFNYDENIINKCMVKYKKKYKSSAKLKSYASLMRIEDKVMNYYEKN